MKGLTRLVLELARNPGTPHPEGDGEHRYVVVAPVGRDGKLDAGLWSRHRGDCSVMRIGPADGDPADGLLTHRGGAWFFAYDGDGEGPDEPVHRLADHRLFIGDYLTIHDRDGADLVYRVVSAQEI